MTDIEWTDETWNPTDGCKVCSPGCANCYAMRFAGRFAKPGERYHGLVTIGKNKRSIWTGKGRLDAGKLVKPLRWRKPRQIFVNSMSDLFYEEFTNEEIAAVFGVMAACPQHTFQILTKRAKRMREWFEWIASEPTGLRTLPYAPRLLCRVKADEIVNPHMRGRPLGTESQPRQWPLPNVWIGVSVEHQEAANERIPELLRTPAAVRFLSCEPLLGSLNLSRVAPESVFFCDALAGEALYPIVSKWKRLDWVIAGCESGPGARPAEPDWYRSLRDQCKAAGVPFFLKQAKEDKTGCVAPSSSPPEIIKCVSPTDRTRFTDIVTAGPGSKRKAGGIIGLPYLDGVQHRKFPNTKEMTP